MNMHMIETSDRDSIRPVSILAWRDKPTAEGYYFIWIHHKNTESVGILYLNEKREFLYEEDTWKPYTFYCYPLKVSWMGPILLPSKPSDWDQGMKGHVLTGR